MSSAAAWLRGASCGRLREESGSLTVFSLFIIVVMLFAGGMAVDFMRQESTRARLQSTLDRAILAAADMDQTLDPAAVVQDYFARSGVTGYALAVTPVVGDNARRVSAVVSTDIDSYFLNFLGIDRLAAPAVGAAEESVNNIEISLVLDVSGSMTEYSVSGRRKIEDLKIAAKDFVSTMYAQTEPGRTSISLVPYNTQVNAGKALMDQFAHTHDHSYSACLDFFGADYAQAFIDTATLMRQGGHFDPLSGKSKLKASNWVCNIAPYSAIMPVTDDQARLKARIDSLVAAGYTSIEIGAKWGAALLLPQARPAISALTAEETDDSQQVPAKFLGRPLDVDADTLKVMVVMTDGINTTQWLLKDEYRTGPSDVWRDPDTGTLTFGSGSAPSVQLTWPELWAQVGVAYYAAQVGKPAGTFYTSNSGATKDARLDAICTAAKSSSIRIYAIGFEVTDHSAAVMEKCASSPSHFFRADGLSIGDAFTAIANDIGKLRLTQ